MTTMEKNQLRALITSPGWLVAESLKNEMCDKIAYEPKLKDTEWETARTVAFDSGQIEGLNRFFQEIINSQL